MNRREFLTRSGIAVTSLGVSQVLHGRRLAAKTGSLSKCHNANVLMITCHDLGRHIGCYGVKTIHTDNIDGLALSPCCAAAYDMQTEMSSSPAGGLCLPAGKHTCILT